MAFKQACQLAGPCLLEPIMTIRMIIPAAMTGEAINILNQKRGRVSSVEPSGGMQSILADVPLAEIYSHDLKLQTLAQGTGSFTMVFSRYQEVPDELQKKLLANMH